ncbi:hypothetical protein C8C77_104151 [Halanaerobium saccharolyticum]|uniref:DUF5320 domain-containing protein n=1 Tax=Halanaerobium saccharolyticum TaxID=43595 RepID=A0A4R7Z817_9FIRM|nr:DUF5320 domain-containing protein [Halanaerobium saccharolyticum]RAK10486.1 hypothetical protein C7958_1041 [Halanaerobium saccharolyticum]TDW06757.1 hypothetical protein C8C77_104151 [Halanaerobium saccharolyticum]TDX62392.1 hypothetical protein C7956_104151 [Halanaerobium saccharolyticum]
MPVGFRRGPEVSGPMPGRGLGCCTGNGQTGYTADVVSNRAGRGFKNDPGFGSGHGRKCGKIYGGAALHGGRSHHRSAKNNEAVEFNSSECREREITRLENLANTLTSELEIVKREIDRLKNN